MFNEITHMKAYVWEETGCSINIIAYTNDSVSYVIIYVVKRNIKNIFDVLSRHSI